ncbi:MAG: hypothetical protein DRJ51_08630 [Thermoprotei archaeon]|nr:MAG: hypothetical protein DRJ51_08630 [Thermoprotei archaeon]RLF03506.1 MAG: hypothetical protein DRJ59_00330 [Thermoprotei archaeon]
MGALRNINGKVFIFRHRLSSSANTYMIPCQESVIIIDPGLPDLVDFYIEHLSIFEYIHIIHTHMHYDHIATTPLLKKIFEDKAKVYHHENEAKFLEEGDSISTLATYFNEYLPPIKVDKELKEGYLIIDGTPLAILHTPGHTIGSICILYKNIIFTGDLLFSDGNVGRLDLPTGNRVDLFRSLSKLERVNAEVIAPGHGSVTKRPLKGLIEEVRLRLGPYI